MTWADESQICAHGSNAALARIYNNMRPPLQCRHVEMLGDLVLRSKMAAWWQQRWSTCSRVDPRRPLRPCGKSGEAPCRQAGRWIKLSFHWRGHGPLDQMNAPNDPVDVDNWHAAFSPAELADKMHWDRAKRMQVENMYAVCTHIKKSSSVFLRRITPSNIWKHVMNALTVCDSGAAASSVLIAFFGGAWQYFWQPSLVRMRNQKRIYLTDQSCASGGRQASVRDCGMSSGASCGAWTGWSRAAEDWPRQGLCRSSTPETRPMPI